MQELLQSFQSLAHSGPFSAPWCTHFPGEDQSLPHLVVGFITHGNEWGTLPAALRLMRDLDQGSLTSQGPLTFFLGNPQAALQDVRFIDEDLNRVFTFDRTADNLERRRALELQPVLDSADLFLDIHQTQTKTESAFWTFPWQHEHAQWARLVGEGPLGITRTPGGQFSVGKCCLDEYVRARSKVGLTLEVGYKGPDPKQAEATYRAVRTLIHGYQRVSRGEVALDELAVASPPISWFETHSVVPAQSHLHRLRTGLGNWTQVEEGELLSAAGTPAIHAACSGRILFPKYPLVTDPLAPELFRLAVAIEEPDAYYRSIVDNDH